MGAGDVEDRKEGLVAFALSPMGLAARSIPGRDRCLELVVLGFPVRMCIDPIEVAYSPVIRVERAGAQTGVFA
jgi:hypothetical protein